MKLEGREAKLLRSLSGEGDSDKVIGKMVQTLSHWRWLLAGVRDRYLLRDMRNHLGRWIPMETGIQYLRGIAVLEMLYNDTNDNLQPVYADEVLCTLATCKKFI